MQVEASYPEIEQAGGLLEALDVAIRSIPSPVDVLRKRDSDSERSFSISNALYEHHFLTSVWDRGVELFRGSHEEIGQAAMVVASWLEGRLDIRSLHNLHPELEVLPWTFAYHESAEKFAIASWEYLDSCLRSEDDPLAEFTRLGTRSPELRRFRPFTSMGTLLLSRTTGYPFITMGISVRAESDGAVVVQIGSQPSRTDRPEVMIPLIEREVAHIPSLRYGTAESDRRPKNEGEQD